MSLILVAGIAICCAQESSLDDGEALLPRLSSLDPDERQAARIRLKKLYPKTDPLRKVRQDDPKATVAALLLGHLKHAPSRIPLVALLRGSDVELQGAAAEALAGLATDTGIGKLSDLLGSEDPRVALAAARALGNAKSPSGPKKLTTLLDKYAASRAPTTAETCRAIACALGREMRDPLGIPAIVRTNLKSEEATVREFAIAALANLANSSISSNAGSGSTSRTRALRCCSSNAPSCLWRRGDGSPVGNPKSKPRRADALRSSPCGWAFNRCESGFPDRTKNLPLSESVSIPEDKPPRGP